MEISSREGSFREQLLQTETNAVAPETVDVIQAFCRASPDVEAAYVCAAERISEGEEPIRVLVLALAIPVDGRGDSDATTFELTRRFSREHPDVMRRLGLRVLTDRAVPAFEHYGVRVYRRGDSLPAGPMSP
jgi:hypothetical protein